MIDITIIVVAIIGLVGAGIAVLIAYLRAILPDARFEQLANWVKVFVCAAEQIYAGVGRGKEKLQYVANRLKDKGYTVDVDDTSDAVRAMIESTVQQLGK